MQTRTATNAATTTTLADTLGNLRLRISNMVLIGRYRPSPAVGPVPAAPVALWGRGSRCVPPVGHGPGAAPECRERPAAPHPVGRRSGYPMRAAARQDMAATPRHPAEPENRRGPSQTGLGRKGHRATGFRAAAGYRPPVCTNTAIPAVRPVAGDPE